MGQMNLSRTDALAGLLSRLWATLGLLLLAGCSTPTSAPPPEKGATLQVQPMGAAAAVAPASKEVACQIQLIDGALVASREGLKPGHHRLVVALGANEGEFVGDVDLIIPAAKDYRLRAEREDDTFTLSLVETQTGKAVATSSAQAAALMTFQVFVLQK